MFGDGVDEVFVGGGWNQPDALLSWEHGGFREVQGPGITKEPDDATYGAASMDVTGDGLGDLIVARNSGLYLYTSTGSAFAGKKLDVQLDTASVTLSVALADLNHDDAIDLYLSNYVRPDHLEGQTIFNRPYGGVNNLLLNRGDNTFKDITRDAGIHHRHNTFVSVFVDLDNDRDSDLVLAQDTGQPRVFRNNGDLTFTDVPLPVTYSYPMGIAVSDYNNDGRPDLFFSNVGNTLPEFLIRGDLEDHQTLNTGYMLLENEGNLVFSDVAAARNAADYGFGWGVVSADFNLDTRADYLVTQNYVRFPGVDLLKLYEGHLLEQLDDQTFQPVEVAAGIQNPHFGVTAVVSDFDSNGWPDVLIGNVDGPLRAFLNRGGTAHWLQVRLVDEPRSIGAIVSVELANGQVLTKQFFTSQGLGSDQSHTLAFGLGNADVVSLVDVAFQDGRTWSIEEPSINSVVEVGR